MEMLAYDTLQRLLHRLGVTQEAAEYHGALCGMLCHGNVQPESLIFDEIRPDADARAELTGISHNSLEQLQAPEFMPVLPDDDEALDIRVESLASWCSGFLYGLGAGRNMDMRSLSEEAQELVRDFTEISRAGLEHDENETGEEEEKAYAELVEYVRVGVQVIFLELHPGSHKPEDTGIHQGNNTLH